MLQQDLLVTVETDYIEGDTGKGKTWFQKMVVVTGGELLISSMKMEL